MYDRISSAVCNCFHLDSDRDHRADHVHSGESFSCGVARSLYVRCCDFLFHSYQKFLIGFLAVFVFANPVFADEVSETQFSYESQLDQIKALNSIGELPEEAKKSTEHIESFSSGGDMLRSVSINPSEITGYKVESNGNNGLTITYYGIGSSSLSYDIFRSYGNSSGFIPFANPQNIGEASLPYYIGDIVNRSDHNQIIYSVDRSFSVSDIGLVVGVIDESDSNSDFLLTVNLVFNWLLSHITELISFILRNAFLAVGLVLFMCGAVISFFVRVKNS